MKPPKESPLGRLFPGPVPPYKKIKQDVTRMITSGQLVSGQRVPSDNELAASFQVSRLTAHRALRELAQEGLVQRVHGVGTFVAAPRETSAATRIYNIADEVRSTGKSFRSVVGYLGSVPVSAVIAAEMGIHEGERLFYSSVIYSSEGVPAQLEDRYVMPDFAPDYLGQDFTAASTTDYLQSIAPADEAEQVIEAIVPDAKTRRLLEVTNREACLLVIRKTWVARRITTYTRFVHPGSRRRLITRMSRRSEQGSDGGSLFGLIET